MPRDPSRLSVATAESGEQWGVGETQDFLGAEPMPSALTLAAPARLSLGTGGAPTTVPLLQQQSSFTPG